MIDGFTDDGSLVFGGGFFPFSSPSLFFFFSFPEAETKIISVVLRIGRLFQLQCLFSEGCL